MLDFKMKVSFSQTLKNLRGSFWLRRAMQGVVRAAWLTLLVPTSFMAIHLWLGVQFRWQVWILLIGAVGGLSLLWAMRPITLKEMVERLEGSLELRAQLLTAFEANQHGAVDNPIVQLLLQQTANFTAHLRRRVHIFNMSLWLEVQALIAVSALFSAVLMLQAFHPRIPNAAPVDLPAPWQEPRAEQVAMPQPQPSPQPSPSAGAQNIQQILEILAKSFRDQAITHAVAEAIDQHQLKESATALRRVADQLAQLSTEAQQNLAKSMADAAQQIGNNAPDFTTPLQTGGAALKGGNLPQAAQSLGDLATVLDSLAKSEAMANQNPNDEAQPPQSEQSQEQTDKMAPQPSDKVENNGTAPPQQPTENERLAIEGQPLELDIKDDFDLADRVLQSSELPAEAGDKRTQDSPFAHSWGKNEDLGSDPLAYPWEQRDLIRRYFTDKE